MEHGRGRCVHGNSLSIHCFDKHLKRQRVAATMIVVLAAGSVWAAVMAVIRTITAFITDRANTVLAAIKLITPGIWIINTAAVRAKTAGIRAIVVAAAAAAAVAAAVDD